MNDRYFSRPVKKPFVIPQVILNGNYYGDIWPNISPFLNGGGLGVPVPISRIQNRTGLFCIREMGTGTPNPPPFKNGDILGIFWFTVHRQFKKRFAVPN